MTREYRSTWWSVELPPGWQAESDDACSTFSTEHGVGALQISAYCRDSENVTDDELNELAGGDLKEGLKPQGVAYGNFTGISVSYFSGKKYWRKWWLRNGSLLLFITYNCESAAHEIEKLEDLIKTLRAS